MPIDLYEYIHSVLNMNYLDYNVDKKYVSHSSSAVCSASFTYTKEYSPILPLFNITTNATIDIIIKIGHNIFSIFFQIFF